MSNIKHIKEKGILLKLPDLQLSCRSWYIKRFTYFSILKESKMYFFKKEAKLNL